MLGARSHVSEILNRRGGISIEMIRAPNDALHISAEVPIKPSKVPAGNANSHPR